MMPGPRGRGRRGDSGGRGSPASSPLTGKRERRATKNGETAPSPLDLGGERGNGSRKNRGRRGFVHACPGFVPPALPSRARRRRIGSGDEPRAPVSRGEASHTGFGWLDAVSRPLCFAALGRGRGRGSGDIAPPESLSLARPARMDLGRTGSAPGSRGYAPPCSRTCVSSEAVDPGLRSRSKRAGTSAPRRASTSRRAASADIPV